MTLKLPVISAVIITLNLKMTSAQITEKPVINNSAYQNFTCPKIKFQMIKIKSCHSYILVMYQ